MNSVLPPVPNYVFTVFEPLSLSVSRDPVWRDILRSSRAAGFAAACFFPEKFAADQIAKTPVQALSRNTLMLTLQLGNLYLLMAFMGVAILYYTADPKILRNYVIALALGDVGHLVTTYVGMGSDGFIDISGWNANALGNVGITVSILSRQCLAYFDRFSCS